MSDGNQQQTVSLGCGTLILIALIVLFFSRPGTDKLEREIQGLRGEVGELRETVNELRQEIQQLRPALHELQPRPGDVGQRDEP